ncbi:hypothetical protein DFQ11_1254 [Winogradskyella epiphytica]|uniref:Uncharacterized protein n=1 Tax=Winogradskyella epiphytica TaxID=262005 RepID=A0A2V4X431_9FLAO|nr:hypothetical protein [Winogradskyella epiphytica]PYE78631.1 hypothetical protein DFQ11_1254 [Winogradskyella epiphytica]GGW75501.1 hypothetical protein GCM10008085_29170 [Winogradskyella epiphytica]|tara:strand:- start:26 stop:637 length:612 start_codon:yes stop_codon:yes gene_type:complete
MKNKYIITIILLNMLFLNTSCGIKGGFQGLYSYYNKSKKINPNLFIIPDPLKTICELTKSDTAKVYLINGKDLKKCLDKKQDVIVYIWGPKCKSKICYPLDILQEMCNENNIELYIVAEYYDVKLMEINYNIENPIFGINTKYYDSNLTSKYLTEFIKDLTLQDNIENRFFHFKQGNFINSFESIENSIESIRGKTNKNIYQN